MVKIALQLKATLENVTDLAPQDKETHGYHIKLKCSSCGEVGEKFTRIEMSEKTSLPGSRGEANLVIKCKLCSRVNSANIIGDSVKPYTADDNESYKSVVVLDCRGLEPVDFFAGQGYTCKGEETGTLFKEINLDEGEWVDYDEKAALSVGIYSLCTRVLVLSSDHRSRP